MIKARARIAARDTVIFGLERQNVTRLLAGEPIMFDGAHVGLPGMRFLIIGGKTQEDLIEDLRSIGLQVPSVGERG